MVTLALITLFHRAEFAGDARLEAPPPKVDANRVLVIRASRRQLLAHEFRPRDRVRASLLRRSA
jgi:hypothetical protein